MEIMSHAPLKLVTGIISVVAFPFAMFLCGVSYIPQCHEYFYSDDYLNVSSQCPIVHIVQ